MTDAQISNFSKCIQAFVENPDCWHLNTYWDITNDIRDSTIVVSILLGVNHWFESMSTHLSLWYFDISKSQISFWDYNLGIDNQYEMHLTRHGQACNTNYAFIMQMMESNNESGHLDGQEIFPLVSLKWLYQKRVLSRGAQIC